MVNILTTNTLVAAPVINVILGDYAFGLYRSNESQTKAISDNGYFGISSNTILYTNFADQLKVTKINGALNTYELTLIYPITAGNDPNLIDRVLGSVARTRKMVLTYGDSANPLSLFRSEEALITNVHTNVNVASSTLTYTINAVSTALKIKSNQFSFGATRDKPSNIIKNIIRNKNYGITDVFYGMADSGKVFQQGIIFDADKEVNIEGKPSITILDYLNYLVSLMIPEASSSNGIQQSSRCVLVLHDDTDWSTKGSGANTSVAIFPGPYFSVDLVESQLTTKNSLAEYVVDVGYPNKDLVVDFQVSSDDTYSILYEFGQESSKPKDTYRISNSGEIVPIYSPSFANSNSKFYMTGANKSWWNQMTQYPISATLTLKGLLRTVMLMSYIQVNVWFYGTKHISSGLYIITKQEDTISQNGYNTVLSLTRIGKDSDI